MQIETNGYLGEHNGYLVIEHNGYFVKITPGVAKLGRPKDMAMLVEKCLGSRSGSGYADTDTSTHPMMLLDTKYHGGIAGWKVGVIIFPKTKEIYLGFPEEHPEGVVFKFWEIPGSLRPN